MAVLGAIGNALMASAVPVLVGMAFNVILADPPDLSRLGRIALMIIGSQIIRGILQLGRNFGAELIGQRLERDIRDELYASLLGKNMAFHNDQPVGDTMARATNDVREINLMLSPGLNLVVGSAIFLIVPLVLAPTYHPSLILVPLVFVVGYFLALWQYLTELSPISDAIRRSFGDMNTHLAEALDGIEIVKGTAQEQAETKRFANNARAYRDHFVRQGDVEARFLPFLLIGLATAGAFLHALLLLRTGSLDLGQVVAYVGLIQLFRFPTFASLFAYSQVSLGMAGARRILELIKRETKLGLNPGGYTGDMRGEIEFQDVTFAYLGESESNLDEISFHVSPGQTVAVVGQTGTGKSTLTHLINRIYDTTLGEVLIDGIDVREWNLAALRRQISVIEQDVFLFSRTISENIAFGCPDANQEDIERAAHQAQAHDFIMRFEDGYETEVGERGVTLSGGQRQGVAIARVLYFKAKLVILDEPTIALSVKESRQVMEFIKQLKAEGISIVFITHNIYHVYQIAERFVILAHGEKIGDIKKEDTSVDHLSEIITSGKIN